MSVLEKAKEAILHHRTFNNPSMDNDALFLFSHDTLFELPHSEGQFLMKDFMELVDEYAELKHRMDGLMK